MASSLDLIIDLLQTAASIAVGGLLLHSGYAKDYHWLRWWQALEHYRLLPTGARRTVFLWIPRLEVGVGAALLLPGLESWARPVATLLFGSFALAVASNLAMGVTRFDCGCIPGQRSPHAGWILLRAVALMLVCGALSPLSAPPLAIWMSMTLAAAIGLLLVLSWRALRQHSLLRTHSLSP